MLDAILKRDRLVVLACLAALALFAWLYLFRLAGEMASMAGAMGDIMDMPAPGGAPPESPAQDALFDFALLAAMWIVMMIGMMLPSAAPTILLFSALERKRGAPSPFILRRRAKRGLEGAGEGGARRQARAGRGTAPPAPQLRTALFVLGYFIIWGGFSIAAAAAQSALSAAGLLSMDMAFTSAVLGGGVFILAGLYELTPVKRRCLTHCRSPFDWLPRHWRNGRMGALRMGGEHGLYCLGCCWALMLILFVGGVMNLIWVAAIAAVVLAQKLLPGGRIFSRASGMALIAGGVILIVRPAIGA